MPRLRPVSLTLALLALFALASAGAGEPLPREAESELQALTRDAAALQKKADEGIKLRLDAALARLRELQVRYTKAGKLDEAVAIRDTIRRLNGLTPEQFRSAQGREAIGAVATPPRPAGNTAVTEKLPALALPLPTYTERALAGEVRQVDGLQATRLELPAAKIVGDLVWTRTGDAFYALTEEGVVYRVRYRGFVEERKLDMARRCSFLALSARGLLVAMKDLQEVWLLDPATLRVQRRFPAPGVERVLSSPALSFAVAAGNGASVLDLATGRSVPSPGVPTHFARITPDGRYYFAEGGSSQLLGFKIQDSRLVTDQSSHGLAQNGQAICVSPDSKYVCLPSGGGNYGALYATYIFPVDHLRRPEVTINSGAYPRLIGFDPVGELIFAQNSGKQLLVYSLTAIKQGEYNLTVERSLHDEPRQFVAHPSGRKLLVLTHQSLLFVEWPRPAD